MKYLERESKLKLLFKRLQLKQARMVLEDDPNRDKSAQKRIMQDWVRDEWGKEVYIIDINKSYETKLGNIDYWNTEVESLIEYVNDGTADKDKKYQGLTQV